MSAPRYPGYKDSGVTWLGQVPSHWHVCPFKWEMDRNDGGVWGDDPDGADDTIVLRSTEQTVDGHWRMDDPAPRKLSKAERAAALLAEGDLVVTKSSGSSLHIGKTTIVTAEIAATGCCYSNFMQRIRTRATFLPKLAWYVMNNDLARLQFDLASNSTTGLANLNGTMIGGLVLPVPPAGEQVSIVTFLDHETAKIDALVEEQRRLIDLLKEKRQAVISRAVTKGLEPNVPMKDSGVEWLGKVPAHWDVLRVKAASTFLTSGPRGWSDHVSDDGALFVQSGDLTEALGIDFDNAKRVVVADDAEAKRTQLKVGDVLVCITGAKTGKVAVCEQIDEPAFINQHICLIRPAAGLRPTYLGAYLHSAAGQRYFELAQYGLKQGLSLENVKQAAVPVPPRTEQDHIVDHVNRLATELDNLTAAAEMSIALLHERRAALISAAVTGKIDVRGLVPQPEAVAA